MVTESTSARTLKALRKRVPKLSVRALATLLDMPHTTYAYYEDDYKEPYLPLDLVKKLAAILAGRGQPPISKAEVLALAGLPDLEPNVAPLSEQIGFPAPQIGSGPADVPELGTAVGGSHGDFSLNGQVIDYKRRPPGIASNRGVFCIRVRGESMAPRFEEGDLIFVDPNRPAKGGDDVLVEMKPQRAGEPGNAYIKRLVSKTPTKLILRQFNPADAKVELQAEKVLRVSYILTLADLVGV